MWYIWQTLSLDVMQIGGHLVWQIGLIKRKRLTIISVGGHKIWRLKPNLPNHKLKSPLNVLRICTVYPSITMQLIAS